MTVAIFSLKRNGSKEKKKSTISAETEKIVKKKEEIELEIEDKKEEEVEEDD